MNKKIMDNFKENDFIFASQKKDLDFCCIKIPIGDYEISIATNSYEHKNDRVSKTAIGEDIRVYYKHVDITDRINFCFGDIPAISKNLFLIMDRLRNEEIKID